MDFKEYTRFLINVLLYRQRKIKLALIKSTKKI